MTCSRPRRAAGAGREVASRPIASHPCAGAGSAKVADPAGFGLRCSCGISQNPACMNDKLD